MKKTVLRRLLCALLCAAILAGFAGCKSGQTDPAADAVDNAGGDLREKMAALTVTDQTLGIAGKYGKLSDIKDGSFEFGLIGRWITADDAYSYTFSETGVLSTSTADGFKELPYTCITVGDYKIICVGTELPPVSETDAEEEAEDSTKEDAKKSDTRLSFFAYSIENSVLYLMPVAQTDAPSESLFMVMYRTDGIGNIDQPLADNPISVRSFAGTWKSDKGSFTIEGGTLKVGQDSYTISMNERHALAVEKDGKSTSYVATLGVSNKADTKDKTKVTQSTILSLSFVSEENNKPNLSSLLTESKTTDGFDTLYTGTFTLQ